MPQIKPEGLLEGDRMSYLSAEAWDKWAFFYAAANGYGRFLIDYKSILATAFKRYPKTPTEPQVYEWLREYKENDLLFVYKAPDGALWGAFDSRSGQRYFNAADKRSPAPPEPAFTNWVKTYETKKANRSTVRTSSVLTGLLADANEQSELGFDVENADLNVETDGFERSLSADSVSSVCSLNVEPPQHKHNTFTQHTKNSTQEHNTTQRESIPDSAAETPRNIPFSEFYMKAVLEKKLIASDLEWKEDIQEGHWPSLSFTEQRAAMIGLDDIDPGFPVNAVKYFRKRLWTRPPRPVPKKLATSIEDASKQFDERFLREMQVGRLTGNAG